MEEITRARTCQNCKFSRFKKRDWTGASGISINGLCLKYADAPMPQHFDSQNYVGWHAEGQRVTQAFKDARSAATMPSYQEFRSAVINNPRYRYPNETTEECIKDWYTGCYVWSAWWIRNWKAVAERKIDRTMVCGAWDGTQTSKFYREKKAKKHG